MWFDMLVTVMLQFWTISSSVSLIPYDSFEDRCANDAATEDCTLPLWWSRNGAEMIDVCEGVCWLSFAGTIVWWEIWNLRRWYRACTVGWYDFRNLFLLVYVNGSVVVYTIDIFVSRNFHDMTAASVWLFTTW